MSTVLHFPISAQDHVQGAPDAPIALVEYGDYQCPYCAQAHPIVKQLQRLFGGKLCVVFRNFPLTEIHPHALHAAQAAESVGAQLGNDGYWRMHDAIYEHQQDSATALSDRHLVEYGTAVGGDRATILRDVQGDAFVERIQADFGGGIRSGVNGTPTFFVNGERYDGDWTDVDNFALDLTRQSGSRSVRTSKEVPQSTHERRA
jgi:protein-disulfide isomerase